MTLIPRVLGNGQSRDSQPGKKKGPPAGGAGGPGVRRTGNLRGHGVGEARSGSRFDGDPGIIEGQEVGEPPRQPRGQPGGWGDRPDRRGKRSASNRAIRPALPSFRSGQVLRRATAMPRVAVKTRESAQLLLEQGVIFLESRCLPISKGRFSCKKSKSVV
jgi:hypothetical protein